MKTYLDASLERLAALPADTCHVALPGFAVAVCGSARTAQSENLLAAFDGHLFDRDELRNRLGVNPSQLPDDLSLVAAAYRKWGLDLAAELDGEFTFLIWDTGLRRLLAGRDATGRGSIYYQRFGQSLALATEPRGLSAWPGTASAPDKEQVARFMLLNFQPGRTLLAGVRYPPMGHLLVAEVGREERLVRFWYPERQRQLLGLKPAEYADALLAAMRRAVRIRLPATGTVASELSAGYDSSGVTALAAEALAAQGRTLLAYTSVPAHVADAGSIMKHGFGDEWPLASLVAKKYPNIEHIAVRTDSAPWMESIEGMTRVLNAPPIFIRNAPWMYRERRMAQGRGANVMLCGQNGNLTGSYDGGFGLFDLRRRRRLLALARTASEWHNLGKSWKSLAIRAWMPPLATRRRLQGMRGRSHQPETFEAYSLLRPQVFQSAGLPVPQHTALGAPVEGDRTNGASRRLSIMQLLDFGVQYAAEYRMFGIRRSDPTADRRLVELCLAIPDVAFAPGGKGRGLYRQAMADVLPAELLSDTGFGLQASDFLENFGAAIPDWDEQITAFEQSAAVGEYLDLPRMRTLLGEFHQRVSKDRGEADTLYNYTFGGAIALGRFLLSTTG